MDKKIMKTIGKNIELCRNQMSISQEDLGKFLGVSQEQVSYIENGKRPIDLVKLEKLSSLFDVSMKEMVDSEISTFSINKFQFRYKRNDIDKLNAIAFISEFANDLVQLKKIENESEY